MGNISTKLDLRKANFSGDGLKAIGDGLAEQVNSIVTNGVDVNSATPKSSGILMLLSSVSSILGQIWPEGRRFYVDVKDDSTASLFLLLNGQYRLLFTVNGTNSAYNKFAIKLDSTELQFLVIFNNQAVKWNYNTYQVSQSILRIDKSENDRGFYFDTYTQAGIGPDDYTYVDNDDRGFITKITSEPASNYTNLDWSYISSL
ncbi:hypothetical protein PPL_04306 [Heterostelium album PN500]|uniref:Uncharacterized protein n=1 Tax=Heterostelium pallidum (strain ATCC 26659 / Pp 5 / PN500) TaxID=670386 RepID=D3B771_HETP5|nr:hypothetical protein PPL_04306 [Heterostelium album PN500]EFA82614.1 hypothetical protein PPL_04306 [Heterostelium album PN500]|eukprot:XP_020434731.1 hypothetical protein PPL_04306 [Heterostelium album PN500]